MTNTTAISPCRGCGRHRKRKSSKAKAPYCAGCVSVKRATVQSRRPPRPACTEHR